MIAEIDTCACGESYEYCLANAWDSARLATHPDDEWVCDCHRAMDRFVLVGDGVPRAVCRDCAVARNDCPMCGAASNPTDRFCHRCAGCLPTLETRAAHVDARIAHSIECERRQAAFDGEDMHPTEEA